MPDQPVLRVAIAVPIRALFDYLPPAEATLDELQPGMRVRVPFGRGERIGLLLEKLDKSSLDPALLKPVSEVLDDQPLLAEQELAFLQWAAGYYQHPTGDVLLAALPTRLRKGEPPVDETRRAWQLSAAGKACDRDQLQRAPRQLAVIDWLGQATAPVDMATLKTQTGATPAILNTLSDKALVEEVAVLQPAGLPRGDKTDQAPHLNDEQAAAVETVLASDGFTAFLLQGITGSGKTEVYLRLTEAVLERQQQVLVLVPEIALTPQLVGRFQARLQVPLVALHSGLNDTERCLAWQQAASGRASVIIGTRSAVFTPLPRLGMLIVDEEHDLSFKQQEGFRYSARDLAVALAKRNECPVLLGSATPSFESLHNVKRGQYRLLELTQRAGNAKPPAIELVDIRSVRLDSGFSPVTRRLVGEALARGEQVMVFINRRGYAPVLTCHDCGWVAECQRCDARMTVHASNKRLVCHHCGHQQALPASCPDCASNNLLKLGQGTEQVEQWLAGLFPDASCVRIDYDSTRRKGSMQAMLDGVRDGSHQLLVGTQMLAKGHDFPNVTLVVMLDIDQGLYGSDFRAVERMAQQLIQVAGRAGRAEKPGRVLVQTRHPDHPLMQLLIRDGYPAFARLAMQERNQAAFPPYSFQVLIRAEATRADYPQAFLDAAVTAAGNPQALEFWGPVPAVMQRKKGQHRFHLLVQAASRQQMHSFLRQWLTQLEQLPEARRVRWSVDVDPQEFYS